MRTHYSQRHLVCRLILVLLTVLGLLIPRHAHAQESIPRHPILPMPRPASNTDVTVKSVTINATVRDGVAETEVSHTFENHGNTQEEADFLYPVPEGATVSSFAMYDGETKLEARLLEKDEATRTYEEIVRRRRDPGLLAYAGRSVLRARVFPILPHSTRRVTLKLVTVLPRDGAAKRYVCALLGAHLAGGRAEFASVHIQISSAQPIGTVYSPTYEIEQHRDDPRHLLVTWTSGKKSLAEADPEFSLYIAPAEGSKNVALSLLTYKTVQQEASVSGVQPKSGYFLLVASPTVVDTVKSTLPRRVVLVMDRSGSMEGKKIEQARGALRLALASLRPGDFFNILTFSDKVEPLAPALLPTTDQNLNRARGFVDAIVADGGTNIDAALKAGLAQFVERGSNNTLLFFTDGLPTVGNTNHDSILRNATLENDKKARAFFFGVGYDVDVPFLDRVAVALRGDADYVRPDEDIEVKTSHFIARTRAPVLENLKLTVAGADVRDVYPRPTDLPDLFAGGQLVIVGRYQGGNTPVHLALSGDAGGKPQQFTLDSSLPAVDTASEFLPRLWATRKIGYLLDQVRLDESDDRRQETIAQIVSLSHEFGILTPYTALFVPEPNADIRIPLGTSSPGFNGGFGGSGFGGNSGGAGRMALPVLAPTPRLGEAAVNASQGARGLRTQNQVGNSYTYRAKAGAEQTRDVQMAQRIQRTGNRSFYKIGEVWTDANYDAKKQSQIIRVKLFSAAYFALTRRNSQFGRWAAIGDSVLIAANGSQAVQFGAEGQETLTTTEVDALAGN